VCAHQAWCSTEIHFFVHFFMVSEPLFHIRSHLAVLVIIIAMAALGSTPSLGHPVIAKLTRENFTLWKAQVVPAIRGAQLYGYIDGTVKAPPVEVDGADANTKVPNPTYTAWVAQDQNLLSYINAFLSREVLEQVADEKTSTDVWKKLQEMYSSQSRARVIHLREKLSSTCKREDQTCTTYFALMKSYTDEMAAGKRLEEDDIVSYILSGLYAEFNPMVKSICAKTESTALSDLYAQMFSTKAHLEAQNSSQHMVVNATTRGSGRDGLGRGGGGRGCCRGDNGHGHGGGCGNSRPRDQCQLCGKLGHVVQRCWKRFDRDFTCEEKVAIMASVSYGVNTNSYTDPGAMDHLTDELDKLTMKEKYGGQEQVHATNGAGMHISHIGHTSFHTPLRKIHLNNVLFVPKTHKNLVFVHRFTKDNNVYLQYHPYHFLSRIRPQRKLCWKASVRGVSTPFQV
jgi:hypothetical protein